MSEDITDLREKIDAIDDSIIELLGKRLEIVKEVGKRKAGASTNNLSFIRAGREANMLRELTKKAQGKFPPAAVATIWRMIISTSLSFEQKMNISAYIKDGDKTCYWRAREYYGTFLPITCDNSSDKIIQSVASGEVAVGVLPLMDDSDNPWWIRPHEEENDIYIFARIPFISHKESIAKPVLCIANVIPEKTEDDISIIAIHSEKPKDIISKAFENKGFKTNFLEEKNYNFLLETDTFMEIGDKNLKEINNELGGDKSVRLLGSYAAPITI